MVGAVRMESNSWNPESSLIERGHCREFCFFCPHFPLLLGEHPKRCAVFACKHPVSSVLRPARVYATSYAILSCTCSNVKPEMFMNCKQPETWIVLGSSVHSCDSSLIWRTNHWKTRCAPCFHTHPGRSMQLQRTPDTMEVYATRWFLTLPSTVRGPPLQRRMANQKIPDDDLWSLQNTNHQGCPVYSTQTHLLGCWKLFLRVAWQFCSEQLLFPRIWCKSMVNWHGQSCCFPKRNREGEA